MSTWALALGQFFNGVSVASVLLLAALGLALSFGLMRVINMAHGELLMAGGYFAYLAYRAAPGPAYLALALPVAFGGSFLLGAVLEIVLIRRFYGRPLDTLLATWGVGLVLQEAARRLFGPTGVEVTAPRWLGGASVVTAGPLEGMALPHVRMFVIGLAVVAVAGMGALLTRTRLGLYIRAGTQDREMAAAMGVNTRRVDLLVFALGSGIAGLAGAALALIAPVTPTVGQAYIVDAFLVVILGGLGSLAGTAVSAILLGLLSATAQTVTSVSLAKVLLLLVTVGFLQFRPTGLVAVRARALEEAP
jgi:urea transport system permease protein